MTEYSRQAKGNFTAGSASKVVILPFQPDFVEVWNYSIIKTAALHSVTRAWWDAKLTDGANNPTMVELYSGSTSSVVFDTIQTSGISSFQAGTLLQYGAVYQHTGSTDFSISKANPAVVTTTTNHNLQTGDVVVFSNLTQDAGEGMQQIAGIPFMITRTGATTFTINWDTSGSSYKAFNTATSTSNVGSYKKVLYPDLYFPGSVVISGVTTGVTTTIKTATQHNMQVGQEVGFHVPSTWGPSQLNELPNNVIPGQPIYGFITSVTDLQTVVVNINSTGYTAFNANQTFAGTPGRSFPIMSAVGDLSSGGVQISAGSALYPSPQYSYATYNDTNTINGPALIGSYVNNTRQGFTIGSGVTAVDGTATIMASTNVIYWRAAIADFNSP